MSVDSSEVLLKITSKVRELCDIVDKAITSAGKEVDATKPVQINLDQFEVDVMGAVRTVKPIGTLHGRLKCHEVDGYGVYIISEDELQEEYRDSYQSIYQRVSEREQSEGGGDEDPVKFP